MSILYQVHSINGVAIYYDSYKLSCFISPEDTVSIDASIYEEIREWCFANRRVLLLLDAYMHSGRKFTPNFCKAKDAEIILSSPLASAEVKENARRFLQDEFYAIRGTISIRKPQKGYIYILRADNGLCKIGRTKTIDNRINQIIPKLPYATKLICSVRVPDYIGAESKLHEIFTDAGKHIRGEWFELTEADIEYIKGLGAQDG